jgi:hypothetical protein
MTDLAIAARTHLSSCHLSFVDTRADSQIGHLLELFRISRALY